MENSLMEFETDVVPYHKFLSAEGPFQEGEEMELAASLLEVIEEAELDQFLGKLLKHATRAVGGAMSSPVGKALGGILKGVAKKALPMLGSAAGGYFGGPEGAQIGSQLAGQAGRIFGLELEGLSPEDQEYEVARSFVRFAGTAAKQAALSPSGGSPLDIAHKSAFEAAQQFAPGIVAPQGQRSMNSSGSNFGRWIRRGRNIIIVHC